ncbi:MAG TPA: DUF3105 domain-containing protein [Dehalococcoidia bacterium]|nr:DUF3105 domain-containing protein [Dehalococcoidia bacterium]
MIRLSIASLAIIVIIGSIAFLLLGGDDDDNGSDVDIADYSYPVEQPEELTDRSHFDLGLTYDDYTSDPPTSGPHALRPAETGVSDLAVPKEQAVHNMEHSHVVVWYNCNAPPVLTNDDCITLRNNLAEVVQEQIGEGREVLMSPYPAMESRIALTSWGYLDAFDEFDEVRVRTFIETFECNYDPEGFC